MASVNCGSMVTEDLDQGFMQLEMGTSLINLHLSYFIFKRSNIYPNLTILKDP